MKGVERFVFPSLVQPRESALGLVAQLIFRLGFTVARYSSTSPPFLCVLILQLRFLGVDDIHARQGAFHLDTRSDRELSKELGR